MNLERFEEQVFFSTVRITTVAQSGAGASIGTGFIYRVPLKKAEGREVILLVSNKHVFGDTSHRIALNFNVRDSSDSTKPSLGNVFTLQNDEFSGVYHEHPDPGVDLACLNISVIDDPAHNVFYKHINPSLLPTCEEDDFIPGKDVWFVGYPENRFDVVHNLPILRRGYIASVPKIDFNGKRQIVIDAQVYPGSSGSPVFSVLNNKFKFIGVVTETMIRHQQLQAIPANVTAGVQQVLGLGIVLKSSLVTELVDGFVEKIDAQLVDNQQEPLAN